MLRIREKGPMGALMAPWFVLGDRNLGRLTCLIRRLGWARTHVESLVPLCSPTSS